MIAFTRASPAGPAGEIYNLTTGAPIVTRAANDDRNPDWQPLLAAQVRPKGATPIFLSLVPAFNQCTSPNATHDAPNPPLSSGSCVPARPTNSFVTVGEPQVNGKGANFAGSVTIRAISGDTQFIVNVADVRSVFDLSDYTSRLRLRYAIRLTDRANPAGTAGTLQDAVFSSDDVQCTATVDTTVGSTCALTTTLNSIVPGVVVSGRRAIWRLQSLSLQTLNGVDFAVPGTFTP